MSPSRLGPALALPGQMEWCAVWKGSVRECRDHFNDKHSGSETLEFDRVSKRALKPEISGIAVDILKMLTKCEKPAPVEDFLFRDILCDQQQLQTSLFRNPPEIKTAAGCHDGAWPGRDHSRTNDHRPLFESWEKVVLSDIRPTMWRTTLLQRADLVSR